MVETKFLLQCGKRLAGSQSAVRLSQDEATVLLLARKLRERDPRTAGGRCFGASLGFAGAAARKGIPVTLLRWTVLHDAHYSDHWAIRFNPQFAVDLTSVQFDAGGAILQRIDAYPPNYVAPRAYPFALFAASYAGSAPAQRFPARVMWRFYWAMLAYDLRRTYAQGRLLSLPWLCLTRVRECFPLIAHSLHEWAYRRLAALDARIRTQRAQENSTNDARGVLR